VTKGPGFIHLGVCACVGERESVCVFVCVCVSEREREIERERALTFILPLADYPEKVEVAWGLGFRVQGTLQGNPQP